MSTTEWTATFLVVAPVAKTVTVSFGDERPEDREVEAICAGLGEVARVSVERREPLAPGWTFKHGIAVYHGLVAA